MAIKELWGLTVRPQLTRPIKTLMRYVHNFISSIMQCEGWCTIWELKLFSSYQLHSNVVFTSINSWERNSLSNLITSTVAHFYSDQGTKILSSINGAKLMSLSLIIAYRKRGIWYHTHTEIRLVRHQICPIFNVMWDHLNALWSNLVQYYLIG